MSAAREPRSESANEPGDLSGEQLGRYRLRHKLADGGMASIYLATIAGEAGFERSVAVKVVHPERSGDDSFATMLADEARLIARIHHPNVCSVIDFGRQDERLYMAMEYLHGETLTAMLRRGWAERGVFPAWLAARVIADAARGLHAAHELCDADGTPLDVVHRDVSPQNVVVTYDGAAVVIDFGVVLARGRQTVTAAGLVKGKLSHMAPEQLTGKEIDRRADVWSLGVMLWEATLGRRLFRGTHQGETIERVVHGPITPPSAITTSYPLELERIVMSALTRDVERRTPSARVLAHQLETYLYGLGRPAGHAEVGAWLRECFSDRLLIRDALLHVPDSPRSTPVGGLDDETSSSTLGQGVVQKSSFAPPPLEAPTGITRVETPAAKALREQDALDEVDRTLTAMRAAKRRSRNLTLYFLIAVLLAAAGAGWFLLRAG